MAIIQPPKERHTLQDDGTSLHITIPSIKNFFTIIFLGFWLVGWAFGETMAGGKILASLRTFFIHQPVEINSTLTNELSGMNLFMLVWLILWTAGGLFALYTFFWQLAGEEIIEISFNSIGIQKAILSLGRLKEYSAAHIKDLRVSHSAMAFDLHGWSSAASFWGMAGGFIAFDYGAKTIRFGAGVDEAEAKQILEKVVARFPQYRISR